MIRSPRDFWGGAGLVLLALFALWATWDLGGMREAQPGPGTTPRLFAYLLLALGIAIAVGGLLSSGNPLARVHVRGVLFVTAAVITFSMMIRSFGLIVTTFVTFILAAIGSAEQRWGQTLIMGVAVTAGCCILFSYILRLPFELLPNFLLR